MPKNLAGAFTDKATRKTMLQMKKVGMMREGSLEGQPQESFFVRELRAYKHMFASWMSVLLIFVPLGFMGRVMEWNSLTIFAFNFLAILPMANMQFKAVEAVSVYVSPLVGGLIDAFLGKSVEMVMAIQCIRAGLPDVLKGNLMGSIHWCLLLVLGMSIFAAGVKQKTCQFNVQGAAAQMTCQVVASISITLPTMFGAVAGVDDHEVLLLSRVCAGFLIFLYCCFIYFHLLTHKESFHHDEEIAEAEMAPPAVQEEEEEEEVSNLSLGSSVFLMIFSIVVTTLNSQVLVDNIVGVSNSFGVPEDFIGATLLPILGNTAEHIASVTHAMKDEMDLSISIAVGSATQIALFVVPIAVLCGWALDEPMSLNFSLYDSAVMMLGTFLVAQILQHGASNWLHGAMLMMVYLMIAVISYFLPTD